MDKIFIFIYLFTIILNIITWDPSRTTFIFMLVILKNRSPKKLKLIKYKQKINQQTLAKNIRIYVIQQNAYAHKLQQE